MAKKAAAERKSSRKESQGPSGKRRVWRFRKIQLEFRDMRGLKKYGPIQGSPLQQELILAEHPKGKNKLVSVSRNPNLKNFKLAWYSVVGSSPLKGLDERQRSY